MNRRGQNANLYKKKTDSRLFRSEDLIHNDAAVFSNCK